MLNRTLFVERGEQRQRLSAKLEEACDGRGSIAIVRGEPGIGKIARSKSLPARARQRGGWRFAAPATAKLSYPPYNTPRSLQTQTRPTHSISVY